MLTTLYVCLVRKARQCLLKWQSPSRLFQLDNCWHDIISTSRHASLTYYSISSHSFARRHYCFQHSLYHIVFARLTRIRSIFVSNIIVFLRYSIHHPDNGHTPTSDSHSQGSRLQESERSDLCGFERARRSSDTPSEGNADVKSQPARSASASEPNTSTTSQQTSERSESCDFERARSSTETPSQGNAKIQSLEARSAPASE